MNRLLVITYHFPPDGAVGGQRWAGLSTFLARMGWEVHVVTAAAGPEHAAPGVQRHALARRRTLNDRYRAAVLPRRSSSAVGAPIRHEAPREQQPSLWLSAAMAARRVISDAMVFPDASRGWIGRAAGAARSLLLDRPFDIVVSSGPPHFSHFAAIWATRGLAIPRVIDMRDPWSSSFERHTPQEDYFIVRGERALLSGLERVMFARAAKIVVNTKEAEAAFKSTRPDLDVEWLPNGVDLEQIPQRDPRGVAHGSIAHVGTLYFGRNLSSVFAAMRSVVEERPEAAGMLRLDIVGAMEQQHHKMMTDQRDADGLAALVKVHDVLPRSQALQLLARSHLALVLAQNQRLMVPAKLYESVGLGVPTLVIAEHDSASAREGRRIGAFTVDPNDIDGLRAIFVDMLEGRIPLNIQPITPISYEDLAIDMDGLLREVVARRSAVAGRGAHQDSTLKRRPATIPH